MPDNKIEVIPEWGNTETRVITGTVFSLSFHACALKPQLLRSKLESFIQNESTSRLMGKILHDGSFIKGIGFGVIGGLVGTFLMDIVMMLTFLIANQPADSFFSIVGEKLGDGALAGVAAHNLVGLTGGFIFSLGVLSIESFRIDSKRKGLILGIAAGALTIPLGCVPLAIWLNAPMLEVIGFSILPHLIWGTTVGLVVGYGLIPKGSRF